MTLILQRLKNIKLSPGVITIFFFLCPPSMLYFIIKDCYRCKHYAFVLFSFFVGLMGMLMTFPYSDQYRIALAFYEMKNLTYEEALFSTFINGKFDIILPSIEFLFAKLDIPFGCIRLIFCSISLYLFLLLYKLYIQKGGNAYNKYIFWIIVLTLPFATICSGLRFGFATCLFTYFIIKRYLFEKYNVSDYIILIICLFTHMAILMFIPLLFIRRYIKYMNKFILSIIGIGCILLSSVFYIIFNNISILGPEFQDYLSEYTTGEYSTSEYVLNGLNIWGLLKALGSSYIMFIINLFFIIKKIPINRKTGILFLVFFFYLLTLSLYSINGRVMFLFNTLGVFYIIYYFAECRKLILNILVITTLLNATLSWRLTLQLRNHYILFPIPIAITGDYDENWIMSHNDSNGVPYIYYK